MPANISPGAALLLLAMGAGAAWPAAYAVTARSIKWAHEHGALARVDARSSHEGETPRLGGIGILAGVLAGLLTVVLGAWALRAMAGWKVPLELGKPALAAVAAALAAFGVGLIDDLKSLSPGRKLAGQALAATIIPLAGVAPREFFVPGLGEHIVVGTVAAGAIAFAWILLVINAVNFMDGIDGLAGTIAVTAALGVIGARFLGRSDALVLIAAGILAGAVAGFLPYNLGRARTFMGDSGSHLIGAIIAMMTLAPLESPKEIGVPVAVSWLLLAPVLFDVVGTLLRRVRRGESVWKAHREHYYQRYLDTAGGNHRRTRRFVLIFLVVSAVGAVIAGQLLRSGFVVGSWVVAMIMCFEVPREYRARIVVRERA